MKDSFNNWFNSPYYGLLYKRRNEKEAGVFLENLLNFLKPKASSHFLDYGCGQGRHSKYLHSKGFSVTGIDGAQESIRLCQQFEKEKLTFFKQDFLDPIPESNFDYALNLFTSFGYYPKHEQNQQMLDQVFASLKPGGSFVLDYFNTELVCKKIVPTEEKVIDGVFFRVTRRRDQDTIIKEINVNAHGTHKAFYEKVKLYTKTDLEKMLAKSGFKTKVLFGDYQLSKFLQPKSPRMIFIAQKKA